MKRYLLTFLMSIHLFPFFAQDYNLSGLTGLTDKEGNQWYELAGYDIQITVEEGQISDSHFIRSIKKQYYLPDTLPELTDNSLAIKNRVLKYTSKRGSNTKTAKTILCYLLQTKANEVAVIHFQTLNPRNRNVEKTILANYLNNNLSSYLSSDWNVRTVPFAGRMISLTNEYKYKTPKNLANNKGSIRWSEFRTMKAAEQDINNRIDAMQAEGWEVLAEDDVQAEIMKIPTIVYRIIYRDSGKYNYYICYHIAEQINGRFISCIIGEYYYSVYNANFNNINNDFFRLIDEPVLFEEGINSAENEAGQSQLYQKPSVPLVSWDVQIGTLMPLGNLSKRFTTAPMIGAYMGLPVGYSTLLDIGMLLGFPVKPKRFDLFYSGYEEETKAVVIWNLNLRIRQRYFMKGDTYMDFYGGLGLNAIITDAIEGYNEYDEAYMTSLYAPDIFAGLSIRNKRIGAFVEYHFTPYSLSDKIVSDFGNSMFGIGMSIGF